MNDKLVIVALLLFTSTESLAGQSPDNDDRYYAGLSALHGEIQVVEGVEHELSTIEFRFGSRLNDYLSVEGRAGLGATDYEILECASVDETVVCDELAAKLAYYLGGYLRGYLSPPSRIRPYALAGYLVGRTERAVVPDEKTIESASDFSYGIGIKADLGTFDLFVEYVSFFDNPAASGEALSIGYLSSF